MICYTRRVTLYRDTHLCHWKCLLAKSSANPVFYFLLRLCGARCDSAEAATLRTGLDVPGLRSIFEATFATGALVLR